MFDKLKKEPIKLLHIIIHVVVFLLFAHILSLSILQSDDYYYATFFKDGLGGFIRLTANHFQTINGRALVHFFAQTALALPSVLRAMFNALILTLIPYLGFKLCNIKAHYGIYAALFFALFLTIGSSVFKEAVMWTSGFYNYTFPALLVLIMLCMYKSRHHLYPIFAFMAGATTEQWGFAAIAMLFVLAYFSYPESNKKNKLSFILPPLWAAAGYATIFLSPATLSRIFNSGTTELSGSLIDIPRLSAVFFKAEACTTLFVLFLLSALALAYFSRKDYKILYTSLLPLLLVVLLPLHKSYMSTFIIFMCFLALCATVFFLKRNSACAVLLFGALASIVIMLPTNTFDGRIAFPGALLIMLCTISIVLNLSASPKALRSVVIVLIIMALDVFAPTYAAFHKNSLIEKENLAAIKNVQTGETLNYNIGYDKNFAMRQMFNDGWFYKQFLKLYDIEDCKINLTDETSSQLYYNGKKLSSDALLRNDDYYIPLRAVIDELGGSVKEDGGVTFTLNSRTLTYLDGIFMYKNALGHQQYLIADEHKLYDLYTLYIKLSVAEDAFDIDLSTKQ